MKSRNRIWKANYCSGDADHGDWNGCQPITLKQGDFSTFSISTRNILCAELVNILVDEKYLAEDGNPDLEKMELIVFDPIHHGYIQLGDKVGQAFSEGKASK